MDSSSEDSTVAVGEVIFFAIRDKVELYGLVRVRQLARIVLVEGASLSFVPKWLSSVLKGQLWR